MKRQASFQAALLWVTLCAAASAQNSNGYVFFAPGGVTSGSSTAMTMHFGAGGEGIIGKGIGVGAEIGAVAPRECFTCAIGVFSPNGYYHFIHKPDRKLDPFVTGGYTLVFRSGHANLVNFGGGVNYWFRERVGLRMELRDHVWRGRSWTDHYWGVRLGVTFR